MGSKKKTMAAGMAAIAMVSSGIASAQEQSCLTEQEVAHMLIYVTPLAIDAAKAKCSSTLEADGFLLSRSDKLRKKYAALQNETWPKAKSAMVKFAASGESASEMKVIAGLPDEALRPFADALAVQKLNEEIKTKDCKNIERGMRLMAPFSPRDTGALIGFLANVIDSKNLPICKAG